MSEFVFVYGTLRPPRPETPAEDARYYPLIAAYVLAHNPAYLPSADLFDLGAYPGATPGQGLLTGDLLELQPQALAETDRIEGHPGFFHRQRVEVQTSDGAVAAWIYWAPPDLIAGRPRIPSGDWHKRDRQPAGAALETVETAADPVLAGLVARFAQAECSWLTSVRPGGRPHSAPVWHVWRQGRAYVVTMRSTVKRANIAANPLVVMTHPDPIDPVILEGWATEAPDMREALRPLFLAKYDWDLASSPDYDTVLEITPTRLLAWGKHGQGRWHGAAVGRMQEPVQAGSGSRREARSSTSERS